MRNRILPLLLCCGLMLAGCTMIPDFQRPDFSAAQNWNTLPGYSTPEGEQAAADLSWDVFFDDPALRQIIETALAHNKDLKQAALTIAEARALYRIERADLFPGVSLDADAAYQRTSDESSLTGDAQTTDLYSVSAGLSRYELDLFGRLRSQNDSALNEYLARREARGVVQNALIAETVNAYLQLLADKKLLALTEQTLTAQQQTRDLLQQSLEKGVGTAQDVARAETAVETAQVNLYRYQRFVERDENALILLMGIAHDPAAIPQKTLDEISIQDDLPAGLPAEVLLQRPDIRQAEYVLLARNADIGAARATFFPQISLTGSAGFASEGLGQLFSNGAWGAWAFIPQITVPIFQGGRNKANLDLALIRKEKAIINYEQAIQAAFRDVADELAARATLTGQLKAQQRLVAAADEVYEISRARYNAGIDSFLSVLDAQRELYSFQQNAIETERERLTNLVSLYRALGGGAR